MCSSYDTKPTTTNTTTTKIFRPWDVVNQTNNSEPIKNEKSDNEQDKKGFRPVKTKETNYAPVVDHTMNNYVPKDLFFIDTQFLPAAYDLEEYARVLHQEQQLKALSARKQRPKKFRCPHCQVGFSNNGQLKGHIRIHTGERPFKCDEKDCGKTFTRNEELTRHKRIHSGLRPFPCTQCGKRFGRKDHLKKHTRTHFQSRGVYAVPVMLPFDAWTTPPYPCPSTIYGF